VYVAHPRRVCGNDRPDRGTWPLHGPAGLGIAGSWRSTRPGVAFPHPRRRERRGRPDSHPQSGPV